MSAIKKELRAVHDSDLELFLDRLGLLGSIKREKILCASCGSIVTLDNFGGVYPDSGGIKVVCDRIECMRPLLRGGAR